MATDSVQQLFSKHAVGEIRDLEQKTRSEIETKKEDLRQMVGERYRDLIEAADTIAEMKKCASGVKDSVQRLQKYTSTELRFGKFHNVRAKNNPSLNTTDRYMQLSSQVKLLMEMSETIWSRVEGGTMIEATHLYMQSRQVLKNLNLDGSTTYCPILQWFPVLGQQAQALDNLRSTILNECRRQLKDSNLHLKPLSEALCSIILLEGTDITKAFPEFMEARFSAINSKFDSTFGDSADETGSSKLCKVVTLLAATLKQAHLLFVAPVKTPLTDKSGDTGHRRSTLTQAKEQAISYGAVAHTLKESYRAFSDKCTDYEKSGSINEERQWCKHLPESVSRLTSLTRESAIATLSTSVIQSTCQTWLKTCETTIQNGTLKLLSYVTTFKGLSTLRQSLWDTLNEVSDVDPTNQGMNESWKAGTLDADETTASEWEVACFSTLGRNLLLWDEILKNLFLNKVKFLSESSFAKLLEDGTERLNVTLENLQKAGQSNEATDTFIWQELPGDILPETAWKQVSVRKSQEVKGGLGLKALTVTPSLHDTCLQLNNSMKQVLNDLSNYVPDIQRQGAKDSKSRKPTLPSPIVSKEEKSRICGHFQASCVDCVHNFLKVLENYEGSLTDRLTAEKNSVKEVLFLAMFCRNFHQLCKEFKVGCVIADDETLQTPLRRQLSSSSSMTSSMSQSFNQPAVYPVWEEISSKMSHLSRKFLKMWSEATIKNTIASFRTETMNLKCAIYFFDTIPAWDHATIQEESETGSKVESEINLPMAVSWPVLEFLYSVCDSISRVGGHSISRSTLQDITTTCLNGVLHTYLGLKRMLTETQSKPASEATLTGSLPFVPTQSWALQKLFDMRMLHGLLHSSVQAKEESEGTLLYDISKDTYPDLIDWLESYIDPFDLDVLAPYLTKNIQRSIHSASVMLGFITPPDKSDSLQSSHTFSKTGGNSHNILPLTTDCGRFSYLPISSRMNKSDAISLPASIKNHLPLSSALQQLTDVDKKMEGGRKQSLYSKLGALSSSWLSMATSEN